MTPAQSRIHEWRNNPCKFVWDHFHVEPDKWQEQGLDAFCSTDPSRMRISLQACAGPGKSALLSWCGWLFLSCYGEKGDHPKGAAVAVTEANLKDNLWSELSKWQQRSDYLTRSFTWNSKRIHANDHPETWFLSARSWSKSANQEEQGRTLSGIHSGYVLFLIDESGDIPLTVAKAAEQAMGNVKFGKIMQAGNPTSHDNMLHIASKGGKWYVIRITGDPDDENRSPRIDIDWAREQIEEYGRDDPWVMAYILGMFPPSSINSLLSTDEVETAMNRNVRGEDFMYSQKRLGVDVARFGMDSNIIFPRQGLIAFKYASLRGQRTHDISARVSRAVHDWKAEQIYVDGTGGYGAGVVDALIQAGHSPSEIHFSGKSMDSRYYNKRAEMWFEMSKWIKRGGSLPKCNYLKRELVAPTYSFQKGKFILEPKDKIKDRLGFSPDRADALCLTFADPDIATHKAIVLPHQKNETDHEFNPFENKPMGGLKSEYDPFRGA